MASIKNVLISFQSPLKDGKLVYFVYSKQFI